MNLRGGRERKRKKPYLKCSRKWWARSNQRLIKRGSRGKKIMTHYSTFWKTPAISLIVHLP